jgi:hypothetical protein
MRCLKAVAAGFTGATMALVLSWWLLGAVILTVRLGWLVSQGRAIEDAVLSDWTEWLVVPVPFVAVAVGFWAGFRFVLQRQRGLGRT